MAHRVPNRVWMVVRELVGLVALTQRIHLGTWPVSHVDCGGEHGWKRAMPSSPSLACGLLQTLCLLHNISSSAAASPAAVTAIVINNAIAIAAIVIVVIAAIEMEGRVNWIP